MSSSRVESLRCAENRLGGVAAMSFFPPIFRGSFVNKSQRKYMSMCLMTSNLTLLSWWLCTSLNGDSVLEAQCRWRPPAGRAASWGGGRQVALPHEEPSTRLTAFLAEMVDRKRRGKGTGTIIYAKISAEEAVKIRGNNNNVFFFRQCSLKNQVV